MSSAFVQGNSNHGAAVSSLTCAYTSNVTAGNLLVICFFSETAISTVSDTLGNTWHSAGSPASTGGSDKLYIYYANSPTGGANTVTVSFGTSTLIAIEVHEYSGCATSSPLDVYGTNNGSGTSLTTGSLTPGASNELFFAAFATLSAPGTVTQGTGFTIRENETILSLGSLVSEDDVSVSSGTNAALTITSGSSWSGAGAIFKAGAATGSSHYVSSASATATSATSVAVSLSVTANNLLVVGVNSGATAPGPADSISDTQSNVYVPIGSAFGPQCGGWYTVAKSTGTVTVTITFSASVNATISILQYSGELTSGPLDSVNTNNGSGTAATTGSVPVASSGTEIFVGIFGSSNGGSASSSGFAVRESANSGGVNPVQLNVVDADVTMATNGSLTLTNSVGWGGVGTTFFLAGETPPPPIAAVTNVVPSTAKPPPPGAIPPWNYQSRVDPPPAPLLPISWMPTGKPLPPPPLPAPAGFIYQPFVDPAPAPALPIAPMPTARAEPPASWKAMRPVLANSSASTIPQIPTTLAQLARPEPPIGPALPAISAPVTSVLPFAPQPRMIAAQSEPAPMQAQQPWIGGNKVFTTPPATPIQPVHAKPPPPMPALPVQPVAIVAPKEPAPPFRGVPSARPADPPPLPAMPAYATHATQEPITTYRTAATIAKPEPPPMQALSPVLSKGFRDTITISSPPAMRAEAQPPPALVALPAFVNQSRSLQPVSPFPMRTAKAEEPPPGPALLPYFGWNRSIGIPAASGRMRQAEVPPPPSWALPCWSFTVTADAIQPAPPVVLPPFRTVAGMIFVAGAQEGQVSN